MKKVLLAGIMTIATASSGLAATKHGFYAGLGVAGLVGHHNATLNYESPLVPTETNNYGFSKFAPGGDIIIGYMAMINNFMLGLELDYMFGNINKTNSLTGLGNVNTSRTIKVDSTGGAWGVGIRLGFSCLDRIMPYVRLGIENRRFKLTHAATDNGLPSLVEISSSARKTAFAPGVGMDFKVNKNLVLGLEYRYAFYNSITKSGFNAEVPRTTTFKVTPRVSTGLVSLKYVWGG